MAKEAKKVAIKPVTPKKSNFSKEVEAVEKERNAAPKFSPIQDEYEMIAGYTDEKGELHKTFTIRAMNGFDEEYIGRQKNTTYAKLITAVVERCTLSIGPYKKSEVSKAKWHDMIESLYVADCDYIMLRIREASLGEDLELNHKCEKCKTEITTHISTDELKVEEWNGKRGIDFELPHGGFYDEESGETYYSGVLLYPTVRDREVATPLLNSNTARYMTVYLSRLLRFDDDTVKVTERTLQGLSAGDRKYLINLLQTEQFGIDMDLMLECPNCGHEFEGKLLIQNFM